MATKKDLVEAYSFSRRRLVTAFLSGAPGGREVEPSRPGRTVVGGLALAVLLIAGAAIASVLASRTEEDWNKIGLVVSRQEAASYVILDESEDPTLIPVINLTSAELILGADTEPTYVDQDVIEDQTPGDPIGISGAPHTSPRPEQFIQSGWTACTNTDIGITTAVSEEPLVSTPVGLGTVVKSGDAVYVLATSTEEDDNQRTYRYPLPTSRNPARDPADDLLLALGLNVRDEAVEVPVEWLNLFPEGGTLGAAGFDFEGGGQPLDDPAFPGARVGDYIEPEGDSPALVLTREGPSPLSDFALAVLQHTVFKGTRELPKAIAADRPATGAVGRTYSRSLWPDDLLEQATGEPCARLVTSPGAAPRVRLGEDPQGAAVPDPDLPVDSKRVVIDPGRAAFVRIGEWDDTEGGPAYVIDPRGRSFLLQGPDTLVQLGYDADDAPVITDAWLKLFADGVELSVSAALCPPAGPGEEPVSPDSCRAAPSS